MKETFEVGKPYLPALGLGEGVRFDIGASATLLYCFDRPTPTEVEAMKSGKSFEIRFVTINGIIWILSKCGSLEWTDAPYNPHLSKDIPTPSSISDGSGLGLTLVMLDSRDAVAKSIRFIGLGTEFSRKILQEALTVRNEGVTMAQADMSIAMTMQQYSTSQLVKIASKNRFQLP